MAFSTLIFLLASTRERCLALEMAATSALLGEGEVDLVKVEKEGLRKVKVKG